MDPQLQSLISDAGKQTTNSQMLFNLVLLKKILENYSQLKHLSVSLKLQQLVEKAIQKQHASTNILYKLKQNNLQAWYEQLYQDAQLQQRLIKCTTIDEHVIALAILKYLDQEKQIECYNEFLKELLDCRLHEAHHYIHTLFQGRQTEISSIFRILDRKQRNHVLITGLIGVGKTSLAMHLIKAFNHLPIIPLFPTTSNIKDVVIRYLNHYQTPPVFILDEVVSFKPEDIQYLTTHAQVIATASSNSYRKYQQDHPELFSKFEILDLEELNKKQTIQIIDHALKMHSQISVEAKAVQELYDLCKQYISEPAFPAKAISILEDTVNYLKQKNSNILTINDIRVVISQKAGIPIANLSQFEQKDLSQLATQLSSRVKGQTAAITTVARSIQRARLGITKRKKPLGSFLFVGPSGVGKTELAKALAQALFGDDNSMIRIDMSEYTQDHTVQKLIGAPPGYIGFEQGGQLTNPVKKKPYSIVLLDEIEKAHPKVFDIFLQVLDDGHLTDGKGQQVDFKNTVVIATSNAGIEDIIDLVKENKDHDHIEKEVKEILEDYFRIEFLNRFDNIVIFKALNETALTEIAMNQLNILKQELSLRQIQIDFSDQLIKQLVNESIDPRYGARGLIRLIQDKVENILAEKIVHGELKPGNIIQF